MRGIFAAHSGGTRWLVVAENLPRLASRYFDWGEVEIRRHANRVEVVRRSVPHGVTACDLHCHVEWR